MKIGLSNVAESRLKIGTVVGRGIELEAEAAELRKVAEIRRARVAELEKNIRSLLR